MPSISLSSKLSDITDPSLKELTRPGYGKPAESHHKILQELTKPHIDSFNWFVTEGIELMPQGITSVEKNLLGRRFELSIVNVCIEKPKVDDKNRNCRSTLIFPAESRQRGVSYEGKIQATIRVCVNGTKLGDLSKCVGTIPIMVRSIRCNTHGMNSKQLIAKQEEDKDAGGYFIINGIEKIIRFLISQRRNFPLGFIRHGWKKRGSGFTEYGVSIRSLSKDLTTNNLVLHYLTNGTIMVCLIIMKDLYFVPLMLIVKALISCSDIEIYNEMIRTKENDTYFTGCIQNMLRQTHSYQLGKQKQTLKYLGKKFRVKLGRPDRFSDTEVAKFLLNYFVLNHLDSNADKFHLLCFMTRKLFDLAMGKCMPDDPDSLQNHEILLPGHLLQMVVKEKLGSWLSVFFKMIEKKFASSNVTINSSLINLTYLQNCIGNVNDITNAIHFLMASGNLVSSSGLGLLQFSGLTVIADKLNFIRFISHFRCVHRGAFFADMRTTAVRKLLPESWGFFCPVHTPDGTPCGLVNHLSYLCEIVTHPSATDAIQPLLCNLGMLLPTSVTDHSQGQFYPVMLDGKIIGWLPLSHARNVTEKLRCKKALGEDGVPSMMEICLIEYTGKPTQYPGLYLISDSARLVRPLLNLLTGTVEMVGPFEQVYMDICIIPEEAHEFTTHQELTQHSILSAVASLTPFSDHNQSPRNMYQCQMGKQTMGTPCHSYPYRADNKLYRIQSPQAAIVRPHMYDQYKIDDYPLGTNAIVAVISYTGYDMEDAMIINKGSFERGFAHGCIYKSEIIDLTHRSGDRTVKLTFGMDRNDPRAAESSLGADGLPFIGQRLENGDQYYSYIDHNGGDLHIVEFSGQETAYVDSVRALGDNTGTAQYKRVCITVRVPRNPIIGDKFASRHGQKGICSQMWPTESIPFTDSGMVPDIIFNPHGFPSRMTIGMMIESMAGKAAASHGHCYDATPFVFTEDKPAIGHFGELLSKAGFNYYGTETMYSGVSGLELEAEIFIGVVYYQRLRHMVSDKFQVRTTGPVDMITRQPIKGRRRAGGIRFGEMERDALLAHGCAMLLHDRLLTSSDYSQAYICQGCGSILAPTLQLKTLKLTEHRGKKRWSCKVCGTKDNNNMALVDIPFVYRYLVSELAAMNIKTIMKVK